MRPVLTFALAALTASTIGLPAHAEPTKVAVVPFAPLTGDVPVRAGGKAAMLLAGELKNVGDVAPIELQLEKNEQAAKALQDARDAVTAAQKYEARHKFGAAAAAYRQALASYDAAAPLIADVVELSDTYVALATVLYLTGDDAGGEKELSQAVTLTPKRAFHGESTSKLFAATVAKVREKVLAASKAIIQVESMPAGAQVTLDGREMGRTPLTIKDIPPGKHLWRVLLPSSEPAGGTVSLAEGTRQSVSVALTGSAPVSRLLAALSANKLDENVTGIAKEAAAAAGADMVVFGALLGRGEELVLESFLYSVPQSTLVRLPQKTFDAELISAGMELFNVAGEIGSRAAQGMGAAEKLPGKISMEAPPPEAAERSEIAFKLPGEEGERPADEAAQGRRPVDPHKTIRVLRPREK